VLSFIIFCEESGVVSGMSSKTAHIL